MLSLKIHKSFLIAPLFFLFNLAVAEQVDVYIHKPFEPRARVLNKPFSLADIRRQALEDAALEKEIQIRNLQIQQLRQDIEQKSPQPLQNSNTPRNRDQEIVQQFNEAVKYRKYRFDDFDAVIHNDDVPFNIDIIGIISESPYAADIAYFLSKNIPLTRHISRLELPKAAAALMAIERKIESGEIRFEK